MTVNITTTEPGMIDPMVSDRFHLPNICTVQSLLFIVLAGTLLSVVFTLVDKGLRGFDWQSFSLIAMFVLWIVLVSVAALCKLRPRLTSLGLMAGSLFSYILVLLVTLAFSVTAQWVLVAFFNQESGFDFWVMAEQVLVAAILGGVSLRYLYLQEQLHIQQQAELASRIQALQSRIRPHFLFNSMNIIASLIESDPALAEKVVEDLSELFRSTLSSANQLVPVRQEIELGKNYLHIEGLRLGDRLQVDWEVDQNILGDSTDILLPHLSLQPLLENAVYHGIQPLTEGGVIKITVKIQNDALEVTVRNPVKSAEDMGLLVKNKKGNSLALENLQRRLHAYYGDQAKFRAGVVEGCFFEVSFSCPLQPVKPEQV
jgi:two-component system sensor histidine kinase AlgZ